jgi:putative transposase
MTTPLSADLLCKSPAGQCMAETINGLYKAEVIHRLGPWKTMAAVEWETLKWVDWFNNRRLLGPIGYIPPAEAEERYYAQLNTLDMVA